MITASNLCKEFGSPPQTILHNIDLKIDDGEFIAISGRSGSGKSTLLYLISSLDQPTNGQVIIDGKNIGSLDSDEVHSFRNRKVGFIFQFHYLLPELTAIENTLLPARNLGTQLKEHNRALELLAKLGIAAHANKYPRQMSGGELQRVAIARALVLRPKYLFADEPTGNLDTYNAGIVMQMLTEANANGTTICLVTHDPEFAAMAKREIFLVDGRVSTRSK